MPITDINIGTTANDGTGDTLRSGGQIINDNFAQVQADTAQVQSNLTAHENDLNNPHSVTKAQVGLSNVDNTSDASKPISTATQTEIDTKQDELISGTNIKTINGTSVLGSGNIITSDSGDVTGPTSSTDDNIATYDGSTGKIIKDGGNTISEVKDRANHTGTQTASTISDFDTEVSNNSSVVANTDKLVGIEENADVTDAANVNAAGAVMESDYSQAKSILVQQSGTGSPEVLQVGQNEIVGRTTGGGSDIEGLSSSDVRSIINVEDGADVTDATNVAAAGAVMDSDIGVTVQAYDADTTKNDVANTFTQINSFNNFINLGNSIGSFSTITQPRIYGSSNSGGSYPFNENGHLILQPRTGGVNQDIIMNVGDGASGHIIAMMVEGNTGNVVIGDTTANRKLDVVDDTTAILNIRASGGSPYSSRVEFGDDSDIDVGFIEYRHGDNSFRWRTNATNDVMMLNSSGNLGIGTTAPSEKLDVNGNIIGNGWVVARFSDTQWSEIASNRIIYSEANPFYISKRASYTGGAPVEVMTFLQNGNVGIGTPIPGAKLDVKGSGDVLSVRRSSDGALRFNVTDGGVITYTDNTTITPFYGPKYKLAGNSNTWSYDFRNSDGTRLFRILGGGKINMPNIPTSASGLTSGDIWSDGGTLKIV